MAQATNMFVVVVVVAALIICETSARSGCASFGHSCYGGVGKRGDLENANEEPIKNGVQDGETLAATYTFKDTQSQGGNFARPVRYNRLFPEQSEQINRYIREWIINYLRREEELDRK